MAYINQNKFDINVKPTNIEEYYKWYKEIFKVDIKPEKYGSYYEKVTSIMLSQFENSTFWKKIKESFLNIQFEYTNKKKEPYDLYYSNTSPTLLDKKYNSFIEKTYRINILNNKDFPNKPYQGWVNHENWFGDPRMNDIIRTRFIVKYLDGVDFLSKKIIEIGNTNNQLIYPYQEAREEGYYAFHLYAKYNFEIPDEIFSTFKKNIKVELQITTQLQEIIQKLNHKYYEKSRKKIKDLNNKWQWNYECEEFSPNYLGHILHYLEGVIVEIKERN